MKYRIGILLLTSLFVNANAENIQNNVPQQITETPKNVKSDESYEGTLKILREKEELEDKNRNLLKKIEDLENNNVKNQRKYDMLLDTYNSVKSDNKSLEVKSNDLVNDEKKGRLPIPYTIYSINGETYAKVMKLNWYYTFKDDGTTMFNGYYVKDKISLDEEVLGYKVVQIENKSIKYCSIINPNDCEIIKILDKDIVDKLEKLSIVDGIPNQMLDKKDQFSDILFSVLKKTNPLTKRIKEEPINYPNNINFDANLSNTINPVDNNGNKTGQQVPKNNVPQFNVNQQTVQQTPTTVQPVQPVQPVQQPSNNIKK